MIKQTQDQWLSSNYVASDNNRDLGFPEIIDVAKSFGLEVLSLTNDDKINSVIDEIIFSEKPIFCDIKVSPNFRVSPQVKYGRPNEDPEPFIDRDEFNKEMYVPILSVSKSGSD